MPVAGSILAAAISSGPRSSPSSRRNRSADESSWRWTATSSPVAANPRTSSTCASSLSGSTPTRRVARSTARPALPAASARSAPSRSTAPDSDASRRRSPSSHAVNPGLASTSTPSSSSRPRPGSSTAAAAVPSIRTRASIVEPLGSRSPTTLPLPTVSGPPSRRRSSDRFQRSALAGSSAPVKSRSMRTWRLGGCSASARYANSAQAFLPRGAANTTPSRRTIGGPSSWAAIGMGSCSARTGATASPAAHAHTPAHTPRP